METLYKDYRQEIMLNPADTMPDSRKLERNTWLELRDDRTNIAVKLHQTDILTFYPDGSIKLDSGGWKTLTTKDQMHRYLPKDIIISQENNVWYVHNRNLQIRTVFEDGMIINPDGTFGETSQNEDEIRQLCKDIKAYAKGFVEELFKGNVPKPSGGDCWYCCMKSEDGKTMGDWHEPATTHLDAHLEEQYYVPSLLANAVKEEECAPVVEWALHEIWVEDKEPEDYKFFSGNIAKKQMQAAIENYFRKRYSLPRTKANY